MPLVPGVSATTRMRSTFLVFIAFLEVVGCLMDAVGLGSHGHAVVYRCVGCGISRRIPAPPTFHETEAEAEDPVLSSTFAVSKQASEGREAESSRDVDVEMGGVEELEDEAATSMKERRSKGQKKRKPIPARSLPLFARKDGGHVVYRGVEKLDD